MPTPPPPPSEKAPMSQRSFVINELLQTERDYIADLELVNIVFYKPLLDRKILAAKDVLSLFSVRDQMVFSRICSFAYVVTLLRTSNKSRTSIRPC
jgi:hypothetical protein